ncbi:type VI secretion system tube protein TssD [Bacteroides sp. 224]|uniref:type VI secretion system tube protein TssD n=1 Tax=Bacteroides sp. 224 TaxID=2302936 RepID=UPI001940382B|nr:type VI secretion system tube protein TssD [Bacteroides sp. 224]
MLNKIGSIFNFPQIDSNVTAWLQMDGREYEIEQFKIGFSQPMDDKGEPQSETRGGQLMLTLTEALPDTFYEWAIKSRKEKDGSINFKIETGSAPLRIDFFRANCINFNRNVNASGGLQTNLILSPERLMINGIEYDNFWIE